MARDYELMYIVRPDLDDDAVRAAMDSVQSIIEASGGEVVKTTPWGKRRLAYEIDKLRDGHYVLLEVRLDGNRVKDVERTLRIHDQVFRHMVVTLEHSSDTQAGGAGGDAGEDAAAADLTGGPTADDEAGDSGGAATEPPAESEPEVDEHAAARAGGDEDADAEEDS